jgi:hypothetical protein
MAATHPMDQRHWLLSSCQIPITPPVQILAKMIMIAFAAVTTLLWELLSG